MMSAEPFYHTHGESLHCGPSSLSQVPVSFKASPALTRFKLTKLGHQPNSKFIVPDQFPSPPPWRRGFLYNVRPTGWHWITSSSSSSSFTGEPFLFNPIHLIDQSIVCSHQVGGRVSLSLSLSEGCTPEIQQLFASSAPASRLPSEPSHYGPRCLIQTQYRGWNRRFSLGLIFLDCLCCWVILCFLKKTVFFMYSRTII